MVLKNVYKASDIFEVNENVRYVTKNEELLIIVICVIISFFHEEDVFKGIRFEVLKMKRT